MRLRTPPDATVLRQPASIVLGVCAILVCAYALFSSWSSLRLALASAVILAATLSFVLLVRPSLVLHRGGVLVNNPARQVFIPWSRVEECWDRWNLQISDGASVVTVWAISSRRPRSTSGALTGPFGRSGARGFPEIEGSRPEGMAASAVARQVEAARQEWAKRVADGQESGPADTAIVLRWDYLNIALVLVPTVVMVVAALR